MSKFVWQKLTQHNPAGRPELIAEDMADEMSTMVIGIIRVSDRADIPDVLAKIALQCRFQEHEEPPISRLID